MARFILVLRTLDKIEVPDERNGRDKQAVETLAKYLQEERIEYHGWHYDREGNIDNADDSGETIYQDETYFEVRGEFDNIEFSDPIEVPNKILKALTQYSAHVSNYHEYDNEDNKEVEDALFTKTVIEITLT